MTPLATLASTIALGMSTNTDNLSIGAAYGLRKVRIGIGSNLLIAALTAAATLIALAAGRGLRNFMPSTTPDIAAGMMLMLLGLASFWLDRRKGRREAHAPIPKATEEAIGLRETLVLASALSVNNIGLAFAGGIGGMRYAGVGLSVAFFSVVFLWLGERLSKTLAERAPGLAQRLPVDGNVLVMGIGLLMMMGL
jgi:putative Mn2+ efflux pump MntP